MLLVCSQVQFFLIQFVHIHITSEKVFFSPMSLVHILIKSINEVKTKSWFASVAVMRHLADNWSLMSALLDHALDIDPDPFLKHSTVDCCNHHFANSPEICNQSMNAGHGSLIGAMSDG